MKAAAHTLFIAIILLTTTQSASAQKRPEDLPKNVSWNLFYESWSDLQNKKERVRFAPDSTEVWTRPDQISVKLLYIRPIDMGFRNDFRVAQFVSKVMKEKNAGPCPQWVPIQLFLNLDYTGEAVWIFTQKKNTQSQVIGFGIDRFKGSKAFTGGIADMELFGYDPRLIRNPTKETWVFVQYE
jgi:hypothetical protein